MRGGTFKSHTSGNCDDHFGVMAGSSLTPRATIRSDPSGSGRCSFRASSGGAVIQVSTSSGVVRITGIAFGWMAPTSAFGSVVRNAKRSLVVSPSLTFRTDVQLVQMPAKQASGRVSSSANQMSPPSALLNSLKRVERHHAAVLGAQPSRPVLALHVADVGRAAVRLHPEQFLEIDRLALGLAASRRASWSPPSARAATTACPTAPWRARGPRRPLRTIGAL